MQPGSFRAKFVWRHDGRPAWICPESIRDLSVIKRPDGIYPLTHPTLGQSKQASEREMVQTKKYKEKQTNKQQQR